MREIVKEGVCLGLGDPAQPVFIIREDQDFWYEVKASAGILEEGEKPELNAEGWLYYLCYKAHPIESPIWVDSDGFKTMEECVEHTESKFLDQIKWYDPMVESDSK